MSRPARLQPSALREAAPDQEDSGRAVLLHRVASWCWVLPPPAPPCWPPELSCRCSAASPPLPPAGLHTRACRRSPLWDQEDFYQREGCTAVNVVSMPFYWPPREGALWQGAPLPVPQSQAFHPTFGAMTVAGSQPLTMA